MRLGLEGSVLTKAHFPLFRSKTSEREMILHISDMQPVFFFFFLPLHRKKSYSFKSDNEQEKKMKSFDFNLILITAAQVLV